MLTMQPASKKRRRPRRARRGGVSLLELLIVLGLLVVIGALAAPTLERPIAAQTLRKSAELVQAQWDKARIRAMRTGQIMVFQYQPMSGRYRVQPWYGEDFALETNQTASAGATSDPTADPLLVLGELPDGVEFLTSITLSGTRSLAIEEELSQMSQSASEENSWSAPVLFYPDGTATTAEVRLKNQHDSYVSLRLRGLTGVARVSDVLSMGESAP